MWYLGLLLAAPASVLGWKKELLYRGERVIWNILLLCSSFIHIRWYKGERKNLITEEVFVICFISPLRKYLSWKINSVPIDWKDCLIFFFFCISLLWKFHLMWITHLKVSFYGNKNKNCPLKISKLICYKSKYV